MTPSQVIDLARSKYNAVSDTFYTDAELYNYVYQAELQFSVESYAMEQTATFPTVASTRTYSLPAGFIAIKRMTYNGQKMMPINFREDDLLTLNNASTSDSGSPQYYAQFGDTLYFRPTPDAVGTVAVFGYIEPAVPTAVSTLETPTIYHPDLANFVVSEMAAKDNNFNKAEYYMNMWEQAKVKAKANMRMRYRRDRPASVQQEETVLSTVLGVV